MSQRFPELAKLDATGQAACVARGDCTPRDLVEAAIARIEATNPTLNAVVIPLFERALAAADDPHLPRGPFRGVPLLLKDLGAVEAGMPRYGGTKFLRDHDWRAPRDTYLAARFRAAGFIVVGKANTPELGLSPTTEPDTFGATRNPWNPERGVGGSSGGSACAVAAGMTPLAHAGDGGGSIRNPAGANGIVGLKPSRGRVSLGPQAGEGWAGCTTEHVVTRSVRDTARVLDCAAGPMPGDPYFAPPPYAPFSDSLALAPPPLRIGWFTHNDHTPPEAHPEAARAVESTAKLLESLGHHVEDTHPAALDEPDLGVLTSAAVAASVASDLDAMAAEVGVAPGEDDIEPATWAMAERGRALSAVEYLAILQGLHAYGRRLRAWWRDGPGGNGFDILITPTMAEPAPPIGEIKGASVERIIRLVPYTMPFNVSGQPGIALPMHWSADGMPVGIQLIAQYGREELLIQLAAQLEQAQPWHHRRPPVHA